LQVDAGDGGDEVYPGTLQPAVDGEAGGHICWIGAAGGKRLLQIDFERCGPLRALTAERNKTIKINS